MSSQSPTFVAGFDHGHIWHGMPCQDADQNTVGEDSWRLSGLAITFAGEEAFTVIGRFDFGICVRQNDGTFERVPTYFQKDPESPNYDPDKRKVLMFSQDRDNRLFYLPITSVRIGTLPAQQVHRMSEMHSLKALLGKKDYKKFKATGFLSKTYRVRLGHPQVSSETASFSPKIGKYGLSTGIRGDLRVKFLKLANGNISAEVEQL